MDFTHKNLTIEDIKRIKGTNGRSSFYKIKFKEFTQVVAVSAEIFEYRICSHFMKASMDQIHRNDILSCKFSAHVTNGYFLRVADSKLSRVDSNPNSMYVNFIEVSGAILDLEGPYFSKYELGSTAIEA